MPANTVNKTPVQDEPFESPADLLELRIETEILIEMMNDLHSGIMRAKENPLFIELLDTERPYHIASMIMGRARKLERQYTDWEEAPTRANARLHAA